MKTRALIGLSVLSALFAPMAQAETDWSWITGEWCRDEGRAHVQEVWLATRGDTLLGVNQTTAGGRTVAFEFLRIESSGNSVRYVPQVNGAPPVVFELSDSGPGWARFENRQHDFPQRIEYHRSDDDLMAEIAGPGEDGSEMVIPMPFEACD